MSVEQTAFWLTAILSDYCDIYHCTSFSISSSSRFFTSSTHKVQSCEKKTVFSSCVKHRSGLWEGSKSCQLGGLANYSNSCKKYRPLFLDFFPILLVYFCNLTHLHTTVWYESCQSCFFFKCRLFISSVNGYTIQFDYCKKALILL